MARASGKGLISWLKRQNLWRWHYPVIFGVPLLLMLLNMLLKFTDVALTNNVLEHFSFGFALGYLAILGYKLMLEIHRIYKCG